MKDYILESFSENNINVPETYHWHIMSADELENVLSVRDLKMFDLLRAKRIDPVDERMDWGDYLARKYADHAAPNAYLDRIKEEFFDRFK